MWKNEPVGFINFEPVECAYLSHLDMKEWASEMWKNEPLECQPWHKPQPSSLSQLDIEEGAGKMWDSGRGVGQKYRETLYVSQDIGLATHFTGSGT